MSVSMQHSTIAEAHNYGSYTTGTEASYVVKPIIEDFK